MSRNSPTTNPLDSSMMELPPACSDAVIPATTAPEEALEDAICSREAFAISAKAPTPDDASRLAFAVEMFAAMCRHFSDAKGADAEAFLSVFHSISEPGISLREYMERVDRHTKCGEEAVLLGMIIAARYCAAAQILPSRLSMHRLLLVCTRIAVKGHHDVFRSNRSYAKYGGMTLLELNELEAVALVKLHYGIRVSGDELNALRLTLEQLAAKPPTATTRTASVRALARALNPTWEALTPPMPNSSSRQLYPATSFNNTSVLTLDSAASPMTPDNRRNGSTVSGFGPSAIRAIHHWRSSVEIQSTITSPSITRDDMSVSTATLATLDGTIATMEDTLRSVQAPRVAQPLVDCNPAMPPVRTGVPDTNTNSLPTQ